MFTACLIYIKHHLPWIWQAVEVVNDWTFSLRYMGAKRKTEDLLEELSTATPEDPFLFSLVKKEDTIALADWLTSLPPSTQNYFKPHPFTRQAIQQLQQRSSFLMVKVTTRESPHLIIGYHFLRCFGNGRAFHGLVVDATHRNLHIGTAMWRRAYLMTQRLGLELYATISMHNVASLKSARKGVILNETQQLPNHYRAYKITGLQEH